MNQLDFAAELLNTEQDNSESELEEELADFKEFGKETVRFGTDCGDGEKVPTFVNEFWTSRQRAASRLHEISYRACFKPQLPRFFIERLSLPGDRIYDPFMGRGTTCIEAALLGRIPYGCDINPLSRILAQPRLFPPNQSEVKKRLTEIDFSFSDKLSEELLVFYHPKTLEAIHALRRYLIERKREGMLDPVDSWIRMVAINRLTGHSPGFFSVYTMPPNQAVSLQSQKRINERRKQIPPERDVPALIERKSNSLLRNIDPAHLENLNRTAADGKLLTAPAASTPEIESDSISLAVTSPPFLDVVDYAGDNWLRLWFCGIDPKSLQITTPKRLEIWEKEMEAVLRELYRIVKPEGHVAFEVGEVRGGKIKLEEPVARAARRTGFHPRLILINDQKFTKTSNCWGVDNGAKGTNTNRIVLLQKR